MPVGAGEYSVLLLLLLLAAAENKRRNAGILASCKSALHMAPMPSRDDRNDPAPGAAPTKRRAPPPQHTRGSIVSPHFAYPATLVGYKHFPLVTTMLQTGR